MGIIKILNEETANKIAAGEVIERPASVVKELVENSIDAESKNITVEIKNAGKKLIKVTDNGTGMGEEDALLSFERHSTSKIKDAKDLNSIKTMGFRGEALASIAAVSRLRLKTKLKDSIEGVFIFIEGGVIRKVETAGVPEGTEIEVNNLFFNTPARKKYLKTETTEISHIINTVIWCALAYPDKYFKLIVDSKSVLNCPNVNNRFERLINIHGFQYKDELIKIEKEVKGLKIEGYIAKPSMFRKYKDMQHIFVNNRYVKNNTVVYSVYNGMKGLLPVGKHPAFFIFLDIDCSIVDVNVHPAKREVRFTDAKFVSKNVEVWVRDAFKETDIAPKIKLKPVKSEEDTEIREDVLPEKKVKEPVAKNRKDIQEEIKFEKTRQPVQPVESISEKYNLDIEDKKFRIIGQMKKLYILVETDEGLKIIDQHAAHERILYNKFIDQVNNRKVESQSLLIPIKIELTAAEKVVLEKWFKPLDDIGFELEEFGKNTYLIRSVPAVLGKRREDKRVMLDLVDDIINLGELKTYKEMIGSLMAVTACRSAIKAGKQLFPLEMEELVNMLFENPEFKTCPHGRPVMIELGYNELEQNFLRKK